MDPNYRLSKRKSACFIRILNVSVESEASSGLHSFVSSELKGRGIAIRTHVVPTDREDDPKVLFTET